MSENPHLPSQEDPRARFRRLLSEAEVEGRLPSELEAMDGNDVTPELDNPGVLSGVPNQEEQAAAPAIDDGQPELEQKNESNVSEGEQAVLPSLPKDSSDQESDGEAQPPSGIEGVPAVLAESDVDAAPIDQAASAEQSTSEQRALPTGLDAWAALDELDQKDSTHPNQPLPEQNDALAKTAAFAVASGGVAAGDEALDTENDAATTSGAETIPMPARGYQPAAVPPNIENNPPASPPQKFDQYGFPLPRPRVNEIDTDATRVALSAYAAPAKPPTRPATPSVTQPAAAYTARPAEPASRPPAGGRSQGGVRRVPPGSPPANVIRPVRKARNYQNGFGCLLRLALAAIFGVVLVVLCAASIMVYQYYRIAATLPDIKDLSQRASQFETTRILDRNGNPLYEILDPTAGRRTYVPLSKISPYLVAGTVATEDKGFYSHPGVDVFAILRAFWQNYQSGETVSGASTITQQLARALLFSPEERNDRSYQRKIREAILATEITRRYTKDEILELYLNENYYGNLAYGVEAASETYFNTTADKLTLGQAAFLAGLPQAPAVYDVYTNPQLTLRRQEDVLVLMYQASQEQGCIFVSNNPQPVCLDPVKITAAANEIKNYPFKQQDVKMRYPHWVNYIRSLLEAQFDAQTIFRSGFTVYTTLDPGMQDLAEKTVNEQVASLADRHATDGALVAIRPATGEILAMVGSADFYNEAIAGQVNMAVSPRQPGSSIKPLTYVAAFEKGWTPSTLIWDVSSEFPPSGRPDDNRAPYKPVNYDGRFHGPVTVRAALANSYNIPAVKTLNFVGIYDDPNVDGEDGFLAFARRMGLTTLTRPDYGLSLTLGGGDVSLLELTGAFATFANAGSRIPPVAITRILDHNGNEIYKYQQPAGDQVVRPEHAYLISSILSDNQARTPGFGANSVLNLPFQAAAKTGTTNDFRDNWTLGYTPDLAVGVWVGNADFTPMQNTSGLSGAAPIWSTFMQSAIQQLTGGHPTPFSRPGGITEQVICAASGTLPSKWCPEQRSEIFSGDQPPLPKEEDLWQKIEVDTWTGLRASNACSDFTDEKMVLNVSDPFARKWIKKDPAGKEWADKMGFSDPVIFSPDRECKADDPQPKLEFVSPKDNETITTNPLEIKVVADATDWFDYVRLDYGLGDEPVEWQTLEQSKHPISQVDTLYTWDISQLPAGKVTLRMYMHSVNDTSAEKKIRLNLQVPTPTPTPTQTATNTPVPTATPLPTETPVPPTETPVPTATPLLTETPPPPATSAPEKFPKATDALLPTVQSISTSVTP